MSLNKTTRYLQGVVATVLICTLLPAMYDTARYQYHHRNFFWYVSSIGFLILLSILMHYLPYDKGITPIFLGILAGGILSLLVDNALHGGVENYWTIGSLYTCLPDFILWFSLPILMIKTNYHVLKKYKEDRAKAQAQKA